MRSFVRHKRARQILATVSASFALASSSALAADLYWDINGTTGGAGFSGTAAGVWDTSGNRWSTNPTGTSATGTWLNDGSATAVFSAGTDATGTFNITLGDGQNLLAGGM